MNTNPDVQTMDTRIDRPGRSLHPLIVAAAIALIVFSAVGVATMTGLLPSALSKNAAEKTEPARAAPVAPPAPEPAARPARQSPPATVPRRATAVAECSDCGVVESVRAVEVAGQASGLGAVAGGVLGGVLGNQVGRGRGRTAATVVGAGGGAYAGHEIEKSMNKGVRYQISVRMNDGSYRTFTQSNPSFSVGQKVRVSDGGIVAAG